MATTTKWLLEQLKQINKIQRDPVGTQADPSKPPRWIRPPVPGAVPLMGGLAPDEWPESTNIEDRRGEAPFLADEANKTQRELMEQTKRLADDFEQLTGTGAHAGGGLGLFSGGTGGSGGLAAQAGLNDIGRGSGGLPNGSDVGPGTGPGAGDTPPVSGVGGFNFMGSARAKAMGMDIAPASADAHQSFATGIPKGEGPQSIQANKYAGTDMAGFLKDLHDAGAPLKDFSGTYNPRMKRGGGWSQHAYGNAMDIETGFGSGPDNSPALFAWAQAHPKEFADIQSRHHMRNLTKGDWGHFEWSPEGLKKVAGAGSPPPTGADPDGKATAGADSNNPIAAERARVMKQLQEPGMRDLTARVISHEQAGEAGRADVLESLVNRAVVTGKHPRDLINSGFYGPVNRGTIGSGPAPAWALKDYDQAAADVAAGRNEIGGRVDQGMLGEVAPGGRVGVRGEYYGWMGLKGERKTAAARGLDRAATDAQMAQKVEGTGKLSVNVNAPKGTSVNAEGGGLFKKTEVTRQTQMEPAASSMASQYQE
jgi:hypothetical protein